MIEWTEAMAVGVGEIDSQHRELFRRIAALSAAAAAGDARTEAGRCVPFLAKYVVDHFAMEEGLMDRHGYPGASLHKVQHEMFLREMASLRRQLETGFSTELVLSLQKKANDWLVNHIGKTDKLLGAFLKGKMAA